MNQPALIFIVGPTAVGKSETAMVLASKLNAEIISCDALQVYREINIVNDKPSRQTRAQIPHHLIDLISVTEDFNVARWRQLAEAAIKEIHARGKAALVVGGSGMYMSVLLDGIFEGEVLESALRKKLSVELSINGPQALHERLKSLDPNAAQKIHPNDPQRIIRALEVSLSAGKPLSQLQQKREGLWGKLPMSIFALNRERQELYHRVEARIDQMFKAGVVDEVKSISTLTLSRTAQKLIGVPEITGYLNGEYNLERAKYLMKLHTRHYVKRQLTWFRRDKRLTWVDILTGQSSQQVAETIEVALR